MQFVSVVGATLAFYVFLLPAVVVCAVVCPLARILVGHSKAKRLHEYINGVLLIKWMVFFRFWKLTVVGKAPSDLNRAYIVVSNHISALDTPMLCHVPFSKKYLTKSTYFNIPIFGWTQRVVGDIGIDVRWCVWKRSTCIYCNDESYLTIFQKPWIQKSLLGSMHQFFAMRKFFGCLSRRHPQQESSKGM